MTKYGVRAFKRFRVGRYKNEFIIQALGWLRWRTLPTWKDAWDSIYPLYPPIPLSDKFRWSLRARYATLESALAEIEMWKRGIEHLNTDRSKTKYVFTEIKGD
jgi:hypothetical protein